MVAPRRSIRKAPRLVRAPQHHAASGGWHPIEWGCELVGTALLLLGGLSAVCLDFGPASPVASVVPSHYWRLLVTGVLFASTGAAVTVSPLGRRSGAHLNPAVTLAFWSRRQVHPHDLAGYTVSQVLGALAGTEIVRLAWGSTARAVSLGVTQPGRGLDAPQAALVEALMTAIMIGTILVMVSSPHTARWTPFVLIPVIAILVWQGAPYTGTSLNPARSIGPALLLPRLHDLWVYLVGPLGGAMAAAGVFSLVTDAETLTAKLYHDPRYPSTMRTALVAGTHA
ncbi:MAG: aquaporin [Acidimicrobiaceae bacterium]|nr:aquaporin [Acidimicrobiaceae bacterium]